MRPLGFLSSAAYLLNDDGKRSAYSSEFFVSSLIII